MSDELFIALLFVIFGFFEFFYPAHERQSLNGRLRNLVYAAFVLSVGAFLSSLIFKAIPFQIRIHSDFTIVQSATYALLYTALIDFLFYWYHRAQHRFLALWAIHELHHSDTELNVISSYRTYWLDYPAQTVCIHAPVIYLLGFDARGAMFAAGALIGFLMFSHANVRLNLGWMSRLLVGPQVHRIHHSNLPQHRDKNLAQVFPIYDIVFGTYYHPERDEFPPTGTTTLASDTPYLQTQIKPFQTWRKIIAKKLAKT